MTSLLPLPLLPETSRLPATDPLAVATPASAMVPGGGGAAPTPDFAGLLDALAAAVPGAAAPALPPGEPVVPQPAALPQGSAPDAPLAPPLLAQSLAAPRPETSSASALAGWPTGKNLPEPGAGLPPALPLDPPAEAGPALPLLERPAAGPVPLPELITLRPAAEPAETPADALPAREVLPAALPLRPEPPAPLASASGRGLDSHVAARSIPAEALLAPEGEEADAPEREHEPLPAEDLPPGQAALPDPASAPQPIAAVLTFAPVPRDAAVTAAPVPPSDAGRASALPVAAPAAASAAPTAPAATRTLAALSPAAAPKGVAQSAAPDAPSAGLPLSPNLPFAPGETEAAADAVPAGAPTPAPKPAAAANPAPASPPALAFAPVLGLPAESGDASTPAADLLPDSGAPASAAPASPSPSPAPALPQSAAMPPAERLADPRVTAAAPTAAPQLESTIAQVGDIREALRAARPAMTLQHAEFGAVSIRLEPAAPDQWRAVLASRDPGFVPAIQAALETRMLAPVADTPANPAGQHGASHNGAGEQRYGASPNGGQGSPQPYVGQSGSRDGEAAPDHRRPSTAAALAARGGSEAEDPAASSPGSRGLFA